MWIVCLGWGSLVWSPGNLPLEAGWCPDGPALHIEFARKSIDGRITLVLTEDTPAARVLWCRLTAPSITEAKFALARRECIPAKNIDRDVGFWSTTVSSHHPGAELVGKWASSAGHAAVVWTALPAKFPGIMGKPSCQQVVRYLSSLEGAPRSAAEEYVRRAPLQLRTPYRDVIERELGWTPSNPSDRSCVSLTAGADSHAN
jgi:hypothetical protein